MNLTICLHNAVRLPGQALSGVVLLTPTVQKQVSARAVSPASDTDTDASDTENDPILPAQQQTTPTPAFHPLDHIDDLRLQVIGRCIVDRSKADSGKLQAHLNESSKSAVTVTNSPTDNTLQYKLFDSKPVTLLSQALAKQAGDDASVGSPSAGSQPYSYEFNLQLPSNLPPTYRGLSVRYTYTVIAVALKGGRKVAECKQPLRIRMSSTVTSATTKAVAPLIDAPVGQQCKLHVSMQAPATLASAYNAGQQATPTPAAEPPASDTPASPKRHLSFGTPIDESFAPVVYNVTQTLPSNDEHSIVRLTLGKQYYRPGDLLRAHLDFSDATLQCYRLVVTLEHIEQLNEKIRLRDSNAVDSDALQGIRRTVHWSQHTYTRHTHTTQIQFSIPQDGCSNFSTALVDVYWQLRFKFITATAVMDNASSIVDPPVDALIWPLPIKVVGSTQQAQRAVQTTTVIVAK